MIENLSSEISKTYLEVSTVHTLTHILTEVEELRVLDMLNVRCPLSADAHDGLSVRVGT